MIVIMCDKLKKATKIAGLSFKVVALGNFKYFGITLKLDTILEFQPINLNICQ